MLKRTRSSALDDLPQAGPQEEEEKRVIKDLKAGIFRRRRIVVLIAGGGEFRANLLSRGTKQLRFELVPDLFCRLPGSLTDLAVDNSEVRSSTTRDPFKGFLFNSSGPGTKPAPRSGAPTFYLTPPCPFLGGLFKKHESKFTSSFARTHQRARYPRRALDSRADPHSKRTKSGTQLAVAGACLRSRWNEPLTCSLALGEPDATD